VAESVLTSATRLPWVARISPPQPRSKVKARARLPVDAFMRGATVLWKDVLKQL
jgi:hypothetical protein